MTTLGNWRSRHPMCANALAVGIAAWLIGFGAYGVLRDDLAVSVSARYGDSDYYHFHGAAAWLMAGGFVCLGVGVVVVIARRLRSEPGGKTYRGVPVVMGIAGAFIIMTMMLLKSMGLV
jgi:hypothetical protein